MTIREQIVAEAKSWLPTPYVDHAMLKHKGCDCAGFPCAVGKAVGLIPQDFKFPKYSPQQWMNSPKQTDRKNLRIEDTTYLDVVISLTKREVTEAEVLPGDVVLYLICHSWTHGGIVIDWPNTVIHAVVGLGLVQSHGTQEGFIRNRARRFFSLV